MGYILGYQYEQVLDLFERFLQKHWKTIDVNGDAKAIHSMAMEKQLIPMVEMWKTIDKPLKNHL